MAHPLGDHRGQSFEIEAFEPHVDHLDAQAPAIPHPLRRQVDPREREARFAVKVLDLLGECEHVGGPTGSAHAIARPRPHAVRECIGHARDRHGLEPEWQRKARRLVGRRRARRDLDAIAGLRDDVALPCRVRGNPRRQGCAQQDHTGEPTGREERVRHRRRPRLHRPDRRENATARNAGRSVENTTLPWDASPLRGVRASRQACTAVAQVDVPFQHQLRTASLVAALPGLHPIDLGMSGAAAARPAMLRLVLERLSKTISWTCGKFRHSAHQQRLAHQHSGFCRGAL